jgi:hypothetical protein
MSGFQKPAIKLITIISLLFLVGCTATPAAVAPAAPTMDPGVIRTEAAQTVVAQMAATSAAEQAAATQLPVVLTATPAAVLPTEVPTQPQPTSTIAPLPIVPTPIPSITPYVAPTAVVIVQPTKSSGGSYVAPTASPYKASFISQSPFDGAKFKPNEDFDGVWTLKNIGTKTWTSKYYFRFVKGDQIAREDHYYIKEDVAPGSTYKLVMDMKAPQDAGNYISRWELVNDNGERFFSFYLAISVQP